MGKSPDVPTREARPAPVQAEGEDVKAAGQRTLDEIANKKGRMSTHLTNPAMRTGFAGLFNAKTGA